MPLMKAQNYVDRKTGKPLYGVQGWLMSEKYDGQRAQWTNDQKLISRYGNIIAIPPWFHEELCKIPVVLDGELFFGYGKFELTGLCRAREPNSDLWHAVRYIVFDIPDPLAGDYKTRYKILQNLPSSDHIKIVAQEEIITREQVTQRFYEVLDHGGEGLMLINPHTMYRDGLTDNLLKYKKIIDDEAIIVGYNPGNGRNAGRLGSFLVHPLDDGEPVPKREFSISGITDIIRINYMTSHPIGTVIRYRCNEFTSSGKPRHPVYLGKCMQNDRLKKPICEELDSNRFQLEDERVQLKDEETKIVRQSISPTIDDDSLVNAQWCLPDTAPRPKIILPLPPIIKKR